TETIDLPFINGIRRLPEPAVLAEAALPEAALAEAGGGLGLLCRDGRGDEHLVAPDDGRGPGVAGNLGLPGDVLVGGPFDGQLFGRTGGRAVRPAKLRPLVAAAHRRRQPGANEEYKSPSVRHALSFLQADSPSPAVGSSLFENGAKARCH